MIKKELLKKFADLAVLVGTNVQKDQPILITGPVEAYEFMRLCAQAAYQAQAGQVYLEYSDNVLTRLNYENVATDVLKEVPAWLKAKLEYGIKKKFCLLSIVSPDPDLLVGIPAAKIKAVQMAKMLALKPYRYYTMANQTQWSIVAYPNELWAEKVFPDLTAAEALDKLWAAVLKTMRIREDEDIIATWQSHNAAIAAHAAKLNAWNFESLHFKNQLGTDLTVALVKDHLWQGGADFTADGVKFNPNIPTEEVFTMPDYRRIEGKAVASKPLAYGGVLIEDFALTFRDGQVVSHYAKKNEETLTNLLNSDEGSRSLGEVALIAHDSPISKLNILFYNTLFDENASCHLALGNSYPTNLKGGQKLDAAALKAHGANQSMIHVDFMFGTSDMEVTGRCDDGRVVKVFENGKFVI